MGESWARKVPHLTSSRPPPPPAVDPGNAILLLPPPRRVVAKLVPPPGMTGIFMPFSSGLDGGVTVLLVGWVPACSRASSSTEEVMPSQLARPMGGPPVMPGRSALSDMAVDTERLRRFTFLGGWNTWLLVLPSEPVTSTPSLGEVRAAAAAAFRFLRLTALRLRLAEAACRFRCLSSSSAFRSRWSMTSISTRMLDLGSWMTVQWGTVTGWLDREVVE